MVWGQKTFFSGSKYVGDMSGGSEMNIFGFRLSRCLKVCMQEGNGMARALKLGRTGTNMKENGEMTRRTETG